MWRTLLVFCGIVAACAPAAGYDIVVYGASPAGIAAAIEVRRAGMTVVLLEPTGKIGGMTTGGLGQTDIGDPQALGGLAREFYRRIKRWYDDPVHWTRQLRDTYVPAKSRCMAPGCDFMLVFEPSAAQNVLETWLREEGVPVLLGARLDRSSGGVSIGDKRIAGIRTEDGRVFKAKVYIDSTYEGDLMAASGVDYVVGREGNSVYGETINGVQCGKAIHHQFDIGVDPYVVRGDPASGLLPYLEPDDGLDDGMADGRVQAYCYRMCLTDAPENRIPFGKPADYDERNYELLLRNFEKGRADIPWINSPMPNRKTDTNNRGAFSTDFIGQNRSYPEASYAERDRIAAAHLAYQQGLMWTLANHPRVPETVRKEVSRWGTCRDEFVGERGNGWQNQLYIREARRMVGEYVMTEHNCRGDVVAPEAVALGAYGMDSHNVRRVVKDGCARNEGDIQDWRRKGPYPIALGSILPKRSQCNNLVVPVCLSASHIAYGSIRMEPVFFALGHAAGAVASMAAEKEGNVHAVSYGDLRNRLQREGQKLSINNWKDRP
ncbi:MAG: FAD-dependent oxidoreductase [Kiritimatiellae bacterium]|nr:FAD-dependent oxidoreductase [Kiritimatiellia bacterium]